MRDITHYINGFRMNKTSPGIYKEMSGIEQFQHSKSRIPVKKDRAYKCFKRELTESMFRIFKTFGGSIYPSNEWD